MTAIVPESTPVTHSTPVPPGDTPRIVLHVDDVLGVADVTVDGPVAPDQVVRVAAMLSCRLHAAVAAASTTVVVDLQRAPGLAASAPAVARVLSCAREVAASRGVALDVV